jgi:RNA polymerase sigma-70 factor (ECF subfamily)
MDPRAPHPAGLDERAFTRVAEEYAARLYAVAYRMLGNRADAEDAVQRALMKCFAARASYSPRWALSTWLYRVLANVCIDELRRRREPPAAEAAGPARGGVERVDLVRALDRVPREARLLLALHYVDGLSYRELATIRGISVNTVKSQLARGKSILKAALEGGNDGSRG